MTKFVSVHPERYFRDTYAVVSRGEPCPFVRAADVDPAAETTAHQIINLIAESAPDSAITVTATPENRGLIGGVLFEIPEVAYALCGADRTIFLDLSKPHEPIYDLDADQIATTLMLFSVGREAASSQWALVNDLGETREMRGISELQALAGDTWIARILDRTQTWIDARKAEPIGLSLPRFALEWVNDEPLGLIVDYGTITHAVTAEYLMSVPVKDD